MKTLFTLLALLSVGVAHAETITGTDDVQVSASLVEGHKVIPRVGELMGSVVSVYAGSAYGLERYVVTIGNTAVECEGDDCIAQKTFEISGFKEPATAVYSRQIDKNTYSVAIMASQVQTINDGADFVIKKVKILLRVKFTPAGVSELAEMRVVAQ